MKTTGNRKTEKIKWRKSWDLSEENLWRRQIAPKSKVPLRVGNRDIVKLVGGAYWIPLVVLSLQEDTLKRHSPRRQRCWYTSAIWSQKGPILHFWIGLNRVGITECSANPVNQHVFRVGSNKATFGKRRWLVRLAC